MQIGKLDCRIRIESKQTVDDPLYGPQAGAWAPFATVWANVEEVLPSRAETQAQGIRIEERPARVRIRYMLGITSDMRVIRLDRDNRIMKIVSGPAEMGRREGIELMCTEYTTQGEAA